MDYEKPKCPRCKTNVNVVVNVSSYYCCYCGKRWKKKGQQTLI